MCVCVRIFMHISAGFLRVNLSLARCGDRCGSMGKGLTERDFFRG